MRLYIYIFFWKQKVGVEIGFEIKTSNLKSNRIEFEQKINYKKHDRFDDDFNK